MKGKLGILKDKVQANYWFWPAALALGAAVLAPWLIHADRSLENGWLEPVRWLQAGTVEGAREYLSMIAGSLITVLGVVLSMTMVVLTMGSSHYGPRVLRSFMKDGMTQWVIAVFTATFVYCLMAIRGVDGGREAFVPHLTIWAGFIMTLVSIGSLIYFIHHISNIIQAPPLISSLGQELIETVTEVFPDRIGKDGPRSDPATEGALPFFPGAIIKSNCTGYIQAIDGGELVQTAEKDGVVLRLACRPGDFIIAGQTLAEADGRLGEASCRAARKAFVFGRRRTTAQDVLYAAEQLVEIAQRALSPGINEPYVAIMCIDHLLAGIAELMDRDIPSKVRRTRADKPAVIAEPVRAADLLHGSFDPVRYYATGNPAVVLRMVAGLELLAGRAQREEDREAVREQAEKLKRAALAQGWLTQDQKHLNEALHSLEEKFHKASVFS